MENCSLYINTNIMLFVGHPQSPHVKCKLIVTVTMVYLKKPKVLYLCTVLRRLFLMIP